MKETVKNTLFIVLIIVVCVIGFYIGFFELPKLLAPKVGEVQKVENEVKRDVYKTNPQYLEGITDDLAKYMYEYNTAETEDEKLAIQQVVVKRFADVDLDKILDRDLREFAKKCFNGEN